MIELASLNTETFEEKIYDNCETCLVVFSRKTCHVCAEVVPMVTEISEEYKDKMTFYYVDVEDERDLYTRFSLRGVPQIMLFADGDFKGKMGGLVEEEALKEKIEELL